jgi:hypothetical protein
MSDPWAFGWTQLLTIIGFGITVAIALGGFRTFGRWKREKIEERRIEVALDALALAYEAKFEFGRIRSRHVQDYEWEDINNVADKYGVPVYALEGQRGPYAVLKRIDNSAEYFERVEKIEPKFMAIFGADKEEIFALLYDARMQVGASAQALYDEMSYADDRMDVEARERARKLRADVFASPGEIKPEDAVGQKIREFQNRIEVLCRPIIDEEFGTAIRAPLPGS